jgi:SRSO17 transposase
LDWSAKEFRQAAERFEQFMSAISPVLGRSERRAAAARYVEGLLLEGKRKSIEPLAQRLGVDAQSLQQFVADSPWDEALVWSRIRREVIAHFEPIESWIVDETAWVKQGRHSVGVAQQYCGAIGKNANCQLNVQLTASNGVVAAPVAARLFLPESWASDWVRRSKAGVPEQISYATKAEIALQLIDQALNDHVPQGPILADCVYGDSQPFRQALKERGLEFFVQVSPQQHKAWTEPVKLVRQRKKMHVAPEQPPALSLWEIIQQLSPSQYKRATWKAADGSTHQTRLAWIEVFLGRALRFGAQALEAAWLVVDWPQEKAQPYNVYLAHLQQPPSMARCLRLSRSRWQIEQYFQRSKDDLGLDHYEGRSWRGFHHHLVLSALAYLFVLTDWLRSKKNFFSDVGADAPSDPATAIETVRLLSILRNQTT